MPPIHYSLRLPNGLTVVAEQLESVRSASFQFILPAGSVTDPDGQEGAATVLEAMTYRGAGDRDTHALSDALDALGVQRAGGVDLEYASFGASLLADDLHLALELYADIIRRPRLPADELEPERALALQKLDRLEDSPVEKLFVALRRAYFRGAHGRPAMGSAEGIRALTADSLRRDHAGRYLPDGAILAVAGRFQWGELSETIHRLFADWQGRAPSIPAPDTTGRPTYLHVHQETNQEQIALLYPSIPLEHPDYYQARMAVRVLSGGMASRLFVEIREKHGLCYTVSAFHSTLRGMGSIGAYAGTTPERCRETYERLIFELQRLGEGVTHEELARARTGVLADLVMASETSRARAAVIARDQFLIGRMRTLDEIRAGVEAVTVESLGRFLAANPAGDWTVATLGTVELGMAQETAA